MKIINKTTAIVLLATSASAFAKIICPPMPDSITKIVRDNKIDLAVAVGSIGKLKSGEISVAVDSSAKNLFAQLPNVDRIVVIQTMASVQCNMLVGNATISPTEREQRWSTYQERLLTYLDQKEWPVQALTTLEKTILPIYFNVGSATPTEESKTRLVRYADVLKLTTFKSIIVEGHTSVFQINSNLALSERRASSVRDFLVAQGIPTTKIVAVGKGASEPVHPGDSPYNMRVELVIIR